MSNGHGSSRRQSYGRRQKDLRTRRQGDLVIDLDGPGGWTRGSSWGPDPGSAGRGARADDGASGTQVP